MPLRLVGNRAQFDGGSDLCSINPGERPGRAQGQSSSICSPWSGCDPARIQELLQRRSSPAGAIWPRRRRAASLLADYPQTRSLKLEKELVGLSSRLRPCRSASRADRCSPRIAWPSLESRPTRPALSVWRMVAELRPLTKRDQGRSDGRAQPRRSSAAAPKRGVPENLCPPG